MKPGPSDATPYNRYSMLRTVEDVFGLDHLGEAANPGKASFRDDVFPAGAPFALPSTSTAANTTPPRGNGGGGGGGGGGSTFVIIVAIAVVAVLGGGSVVVRRRRQHRDRTAALTEE